MEVQTGVTLDLSEPNEPPGISLRRWRGKFSKINRRVRPYFQPGVARNIDRVVKTDTISMTIDDYFCLAGQTDQPCFAIASRKGLIAIIAIQDDSPVIEVEHRAVKRAD